MLLESQGSNPCRSNMPKTFLQKLTPQLFNTWLVNKDQYLFIINIYDDEENFYYKKNYYKGFCAKKSKGNYIYIVEIKNLEVDLEYLLDTYKLNDSKMKDKLNRMLAKNLLKN